VSLFKRPSHVPLTDVWIETGTYHGDGVASALLHGYKRCISIELYPPSYEVARRRFAGDRRVQIVLGASPMILPAVTNPARSTTFWLDAHYSGGPGERHPQYGECPLLFELDAIMAQPWEIPPVILVDDAFMFAEPVRSRGAVAFDPGAWPTLEQIRTLLPGYELDVIPTQDGDAPPTQHGMIVARAR
jgi:hypothetical protein